MLARLTSSLLKAFEETELKIAKENMQLFCDSTTVLAWLKSDATRFKPFVKNKVVEIQELTSQKVWRYIPSSKNKSADMISKGCDHNDLKYVLEGPEFMRMATVEWPEASVNASEEDNVFNEEVKSKEYGITVTMAEPNVIGIEKYSSWKNLLRVTSYVLRFITQLKVKVQAKQANERKQTNKNTVKSKVNVQIVETPNAEEMKLAEQLWIKHAQLNLTQDDKRTRKLVPFVDENGIQRVSGRIEGSNIFDYDRSHPIILPEKSPVAELILDCIHKELFHPGHLRIIAESRKKFWILNARKIAKHICYKCVICRRWRRKACEQMMSNLPESRLAVRGSPFQHCCTDYFGPISVKYRGRAQRKGYGIIFTCLTTRAIRIEFVTDVSNDKFLLAFRRFISLYGIPLQVRNDNGSNFIGAAREIKEMIIRWKRQEEADSHKLKDFSAEYVIKWTFSTPLSPHHNGAVEAMVKSVKSSLNKILKETCLSEEEYRTMFAEIEACINARPLWPVSDVT